MFIYFHMKIHVKNKELHRFRASSSGAIPSPCSTQGRKEQENLLHQHLLELECAGRASVPTEWGRDGDAPHPWLASRVGSPISEPWSCFFNPTSSPRGGKHPARAPSLFIPELSPGPPHGQSPSRAQVLWGCLQAPRGWVISQPSRVVVPALKAMKARIWLQNPGGRGQTPTLVTNREHCTAQSPQHPCRARAGPSSGAEGAAGVEREVGMFKKNPRFWDGAVGSAQVAKATEAELLLMPRACRDRAQHVMYSNQPLLKAFCRLKIPQMITAN